MKHYLRNMQPAKTTQNQSKPLATSQNYLQSPKNHPQIVNILHKFLTQLKATINYQVVRNLNLV